MQYPKTLLINLTTYKARSSTFIGQFTPSRASIHSLNITVDTRHIQYRYSTKAEPAEKLDIEDIRLANEEQQMGELTNL